MTCLKSLIVLTYFKIYLHVSILDVFMYLLFSTRLVHVGDCDNSEVFHRLVSLP